MHPNDEYIARHRRDDVNALALSLHSLPHLDADYILRQIEALQRLERKVPEWTQTDGLLYPPRLALEQCSSSFSARYKAAVAARFMPDLSRPAFADLTGGMGVDFSFMARPFEQAVYVERQPELVRCARRNFPLLGLPQAEIIEGDGVAHLKQMAPVGMLFLDPARRDGAGRKTVLIEDCRPDVAALLPLLKAKADVVIVKLSPMLDVLRALKTLGGATEVHLVSDGRECKELLLVLSAADTSDPPLICAEGDTTFSFRRSKEAALQPPTATAICRYLYEPGPALMKAGAFSALAAAFDVAALHPNSHLYTSDRLIPDFPGRRFEVLRVAGFKKAEIRGFIGDLPHANLTIRNFPMTVDALRRKLKVKEGGNEYWFATTLAPNTHILLACRKVET